MSTAFSPLLVATPLSGDRRVVRAREVPGVQRGDRGQRGRDRLARAQRHEPHGERGVRDVGEIDREFLVPGVRVLCRAGFGEVGSGTASMIWKVPPPLTILHQSRSAPCVIIALVPSGSIDDGRGRISEVREPPDRLARRRLDFILHQHLVARAHQARAAPDPRHAAVNRREIMNRKRTGAARLALIRERAARRHRAPCRRWRSGLIVSVFCPSGRIR